MGGYTSVMASAWVWRVLLWLLLGWGTFRVVDAHRYGVYRCWIEDRCPCPFLGQCLCRLMNEGSAAQGLREIAAAQLVHREKVKGYWRADVAGLYVGNGPPNEWPRQISLATALADARPSTDLLRVGTPATQYGYHYRALRHAEENPPASDRWAAAAEPEPRAGSCVLVIDERGTIWHAPIALVGRPECFPSDAELERQWRRVGTGRSFDWVRGAILLGGGLVGLILTAYVLAPAGPAAPACLGLIAVALLPPLAVAAHPWLAWRGVRWGLDCWAPPGHDLFLRIGLGVALAPIMGALALALCAIAVYAGPWAR
jgi:hypothetical protein